MAFSVEWKKGFFSTTRGRILLLLRRAKRTVKELAEELGLAENAVRVQLATMQRYGLVDQGVRRTPGAGAGKPAYEYRLTPQAQSLFPVAHAIMLDSLLAVMEEGVSTADYEEQLRAAGRRMASLFPISSGNSTKRLEEVIGVLDNLGGVMEIEDRDETPKKSGFTICGYSCPLSDIPQSHPQACKVIEEMLGSLLGVPVQEKCERGELLACKFEVPKV